MATKKELISETILQVTQSSPSDDLSLDERQIAFWATYVLNSLVATEVNSKIERGENIPAIYIKTAQCEPMEVEDNDCSDGCQDRIYAELDEEVLVVNKDSGIVRVITDEGDLITKGFPQTMDMLRYMPFAKPSLENPIYYLQGTKVFVEGFKAVDLPFNKLHISYIPKQDVSTLDDDDTVLASDLVLPQLIGSLVSIAKQELYGSMPDQANDGVDVKQPNYLIQARNPE